jgi:hypothetical protein
VSHAILVDVALGLSAIQSLRWRLRHELPNAPRQEGRFLQQESFFNHSKCFPSLLGAQVLEWPANKTLVDGAKLGAHTHHALL